MLRPRFAFTALSCFLFAAVLGCSGTPEMEEIDISQLPPDEQIFELIERGDASGLEQLLDQYPDIVHVQGTAAATPLHCAASYGEAKAAKLLLDRGADPDAVNEFGQTPRDIAGVEGHKDIVKLFEGG